MKRMLSILLVLCVMVSLCPVVLASDAEKYLFCPSQAITRGDICDFLWRANGCPEPRSLDNPFSDIANDSTFLKPVLWALETNITGGIGNGKFGPDTACTRAQIVSFLWAVNGKPEPKSTSNPFSDVANDAWYLKPVLWYVESGIGGGTSPTTFSPDAFCTRANAITFLYKIYSDKLVNNSNEIPFSDVSASDWYASPVLWGYANGIIRLDNPKCYHSEIFIPSKNANCEENGLTDGKQCSICGEILVAQEVIPATGHDYVGVVITAATCKDYGLKQYVCKNDASHTYNELLEPNGIHKFSAGKCSVCGAADPDYVAPAPVTNPFADILESDWFYNPVMWAVNAGVTSGVDATHFGPLVTCTRAQVVTFLYAAAGRPEVTATVEPFEDVSASDWFYTPVLWAVENGITSGVDATHFEPNTTCNRAAVVTFLYAMAGRPEVTAKSEFADVADSDWFAKPVIWAKETRVTGGINATDFGPLNDCNRAAVVTFLYKVYDSNTETLPVPTVKPTLTPAPITPTPTASSLKIHFIDVGQADAALVECDGHYMLIDGGNKADSNKIYSVLQNAGVPKLDILVATHAHEDHVGGLAGALNYTSADVILSPVTDYDSNVFRDFVKYANMSGGITVPNEGDTYTLGSAKVTVLGLNLADSVNNSSIVLRIDHGSNSFLFMGDAERDAEMVLLEKEIDLTATVLKVGHHGSETSSSYPLLYFANPQYAVISVGEGNSYGHPTENTLSRLRDADVKLYRTDMQGDIYCVSDGSNLTFQVTRNANADVFGNAGSNDTQPTPTLTPEQTPTPTPVPTPESTPEPTPTPTPEPTPDSSVGQMVWIPRTGTKYHSYAGCSNMKNPSQVTLAQAQAMGYSPCKRCH